MKNKLAKLIDVKSIMTLLLTVVFCVLALTGAISAGQFVTSCSVIGGFYFGTQAPKKASTAEKRVAEQTEALPVSGSTEPIHDTVDAMTINEVHPPDGDADVMNGIGFEY